MRRILAITALVLSMNAATSVAKPPSWDTVIDSPSRFKVLKQFDFEAVFDKETGLVWERTPSGTPDDWRGSHLRCLADVFQGGWRLPAAEELMTLSDSTRNPSLPEGHPFIGADGANREYWTATTSHDDPNDAYGVKFDQSGITLGPKTNLKRTWCVRGGQGIDGGH